MASIRLTDAQRGLAEVEEWGNPDIWDHGGLQDRREWLAWLSASEGRSGSIDVSDGMVGGLVLDWLNSRANAKDGEKESCADEEQRRDISREIGVINNLANKVARSI